MNSNGFVFTYSRLTIFSRIGLRPYPGSYVIVHENSVLQSLFPTRIIIGNRRIFVRMTWQKLRKSNYSEVD